MKNWQPSWVCDVCCLCLSAGIHLTSTACGVCSWVCVRDGVWCISSLLGSNQTRSLKAFPPARLPLWRGDVIIHQEPKPSSSGPHCHFHRLPSDRTTYACRFGPKSPPAHVSESSGSAGAVSWISFSTFIKETLIWCERVAFPARRKVLFSLSLIVYCLDYANQICKL